VRPARPLLAGAAGALALAGCSSPESPAEAVAEDFYHALSASDWPAACALLAPATVSALERSAGTGCPEALAAEDLPDPGALRSSSRFGTMAQTRFGADTVFLTRFGHRWRVVAAGCAPVPSRPYECRLEGG
jgi:hypothetical protein